MNLIITAGLNTSNVGKSKTIIGKTSVIFGASAVVVIVLIGKLIHLCNYSQLAI